MRCICIAFVFAIEALALAPSVKPLKPTTRRDFVRSVYPSVTGLVLAQTISVSAFDNALPEAAKFADRPKRRGPQPSGLGLAVRPDGAEGDNSPFPVLKECKGSPNCFSTTGAPDFDVDSLIRPWQYPSSLTIDSAALQVEDAVSEFAVLSVKYTIGPP
jgi:hypothetical protein